MKLVVRFLFTLFLCIVAIFSYLSHLFLTAIFSIFGNWLYTKTAFFGGFFIDIFHEIALFIVFFVSSFFLKKSSYYTVDRAFFYASLSTLISVWQIKLNVFGFSLEHLIIYFMPGLGVFLSFMIGEIKKVGRLTVKGDISKR